MSPLTIAWTATGAICLTLGLVYLVVWLQQRTSKAHLFFALAALGAGANAFCDLATMKARSVEEWVFWAKLAHVPPKSSGSPPVSDFEETGRALRGSDQSITSNRAGSKPAGGRE